MNKIFFSNLVPGTVLFSRFELMACLNASNIGGVYLCRDVIEADKLVALKILSTEASQDEEHVVDFENEVRLSSRIFHSNVVRGEEFFRDEDFTAIAMEYVEGGTLADYLERKKVVSVREALFCLTQLAEGLQAVHDAGVIHRDLKPENILIDAFGRLKIADFGIAALNSEKDSIPATGMTGTVDYLSPEYITHGEFDERSDIYAFGLIAYKLLTGRLPFSGEDIVDTLSSKIRMQPVSPSAIRADIPESLSHLVLKSLKRNPRERYQNMTALLVDLDIVASLEEERQRELALQLVDSPFDGDYAYAV